MRVHATQLEESESQAIVSALLEQAPPARRAKALRFQNPADAARALLGDRLVRSVAAEETGIAIHRLEWTDDVNGKPKFENAPRFYFNLSHSGDWVVCATDDRPLGIDIERIRPIGPDVARISLSVQEHRAFERRNARGRERFFYRQWTLKESYAKSVGLGLRLPFETVSILSGTVVRDGEDCPEFFFRSYLPAVGYEMAVCARHDGFPNTIEYRDLLTRGPYDEQQASG